MFRYFLSCSFLLIKKKWDGQAAVTLLSEEAAAALLRDNVTLFGDQEALRESLRELGDRASWGFLPYPQFVRSMQWCWPDGCAGYSDAHTFHDAKAGDVMAYAGAMTQRGLTATQRVRTT